MDDLVVNSELTAAVIDNQDANTTTPIRKRIVESRPESSLIDDRKTLLDVSRLGHGDNTSIVTNVKHTILLENRAKHVLDDD